MADTYFSGNAALTLVIVSLEVYSLVQMVSLVVVVGGREHRGYLSVGPFVS